MFFSDDINKPNLGKVPSPYQAIIFAEDDFNSKINSLTRGLPASLLPIANQPALYYILNWLEKSNIKDVIIVLPLSSNLQAEAQLTHYLSKVYQGSVKVEIYPVDSDVKSIKALNMLKHKIHGNFLVFGSSFLCDLPLKNLLDFHTRNLPLLSAYFYENTKVENNEAALPNIIGVEPNLSRWIYSKKHTSETDLEIKMSLLNKFPRVNFHQTLHNSDVYVFSHTILDFISQNLNLETICDDLVPLLVKLQSRKNLKGHSELTKSINNKSTIAHSLVQQYTTLNGKKEGYVNKKTNDDIICNILIERSGIHGKLDSIVTYHDLNKQFAKSLSNEQRVPASVEKDTTAQIGPDSIVGNSTILNERTSIKKSIIGNHCVIGKQVKIANSIIMDHVIIEDNVKLDNCVVCSNATISEKVNLKDCEVAQAIKVDKNVTKKGEAIID